MSDYETLIARATKAYRLRCYKAGGEPQQPCRYSSDVEEEDGAIMVVLRNVNGTLATYEYQPEKDRLRWIGSDSLAEPTSSWRYRRVTWRREMSGSAAIAPKVTVQRFQELLDSGHWCWSSEPDDEGNDVILVFDDTEDMIPMGEISVPPQLDESDFDFDVRGG